MTELLQLSLGASMKKSDQAKLVIVSNKNCSGSAKNFSKDSLDVSIEPAKKLDPNRRAVSGKQSFLSAISGKVVLICALKSAD
ncbi:hypothetical protein FBZ94_1272 [Bradyrhizobium sacchari]|uniref:Uncharacterized protein n=1 Tax=Bradyrhizobium sacchari TaxID=1399419 RepID=A0A560HKV6_9BRAD|nr:hypothetical protein FBZ94_1272 [Bradyrhizobium sacchari]TWB65750.1 hypothetical protein FBZ95_1261 [Bradyrhizobium sacchari]